MSDRPLRVAFFPDTYDEIDGVANTSRQFEAYARRHNLPFLTVHGGLEDAFEANGSTMRVRCRRGPFGFAIDKKHDFDLAFWRHLGAVEEVMAKFDPDIIHITGPSDAGQLGVAIAHRMRIPLAASWHTNVHEYAEMRAAGWTRMLPDGLQPRVGKAIREITLLATLRFYHIAQVLFAPNPELIEMVEKGTRKPCYPMNRGVDTELFHPRKRERSEDAFVVGFVGRLSVEKNIRDLVEVEQYLIRAGVTNYRFLIVGQGAEEPWLRQNMKQAEFTGILRGEELAKAYAGMDVLAFPSHTDTYGNVVLEAFASGVPAVVTDHGGPRFIVHTGETGFVTSGSPDFCDAVLRIARNPAQLEMMRHAARAQAMTLSWDAVFESVYAAYEYGLRAGIHAGKKVRARSGMSGSLGQFSMNEIR